MKIAVYSSQPYDEKYLSQIFKQSEHELTFIPSRLTPLTAPLSQGHDAICTFVNDQVHSDTIQVLPDSVKLICNRCAGFNNIDLKEASSKNIVVARVPAYSPYATAEHTVSLLMTLNRKIHKAYNRVRDGNFTINGLLGFDLHGKTVGVVGTGQIGTIVTRILSQGFGCNALCYDVYRSKEVEQMKNVRYVDTLEELYSQSDIISLHCPLTKETDHLINENTINQMKDGVILLNASRGSVIETKDVINALKKNKIGGLAIDVYENEGAYFYSNYSDKVVDDDILSRLLSFPNVLVTSHQAFFTHEAMTNISQSVFDSVKQFSTDGTVPEKNLVKPN
jgi:D-lactate dehydrogenase